MSHQIDPPSYREGNPLPRCITCYERSVRDGVCLDAGCPSHKLCEWCGEREAVAILTDGDAVCGTCGLAELRARRATGSEVAP